MLAGTDQLAGYGGSSIGSSSHSHLAMVDQMATLADFISFCEYDAKTGRKGCQAQTDTDVRTRLSPPRNQGSYEDGPLHAASLIWVEAVSSLLILYQD